MGLFWFPNGFHIFMIKKVIKLVTFNAFNKVYNDNYLALGQLHLLAWTPWQNI